MSIGKDLRAWIMSVVSEVADRVHQDFVPQMELLLTGECMPSDIEPFIYFSRIATDRDRCLEGDSLPDIHSFTLEIIGQDVDTVRAISDKLFAKDGFQGSLGASTIYNGVFVESQDDDYVPYNPASEFGLAITSLQVDIIP